MGLEIKVAFSPSGGNLTMSTKKGDNGRRTSRKSSGKKGRKEGGEGPYRLSVGAASGKNPRFIRERGDEKEGASLPVLRAGEEKSGGPPKKSARSAFVLELPISRHPGRREGLKGGGGGKVAKGHFVCQVVG